jgi:hypothetical protein
MRHRKIFAFVLFCGIAAGCSRQLPPGERNNYRPFGVQHAALHLEYFGNTRGTEDLYEDSSGLREAHFTHFEVIGQDAFHPTFVYTLRDIGAVTIVDSVKMQTVRLVDKTTDSLFHLPSDEVPTPDGQFGSFFARRGFVLRGDTNIVASGVTLKAHIWQQAEEPSYIFEYKGLTVGKMNNYDGRENDLRLMSIDTVTPIDPSRFVAPNGFPVMDMTKTKTPMPDARP